MFLIFFNQRLSGVETRYSKNVDNWNSDNRIETSLNIKSYNINDNIETIKLSLPLIRKIKKNNKGTNTINQSDFLNKRHNKIIREHSIKIIKSSFEEKKK